MRREGADAPPSLRESQQPLIERYDCVMLDLDGVVYRGPHAIAGVPQLLTEARDGGVRLAFVTNNAARPPAEIAAHLRDLGIEAKTSDVVTSAQAAAREVQTRVPPGAPVLVVGGDGLTVALRELGLTPVGAATPGSSTSRPAAVVQGFGPDVDWRQLAQASYLVAAGVLWVASNLDLTVPTAEGIAPGNGSLVAAVAAAAGRRPDVVAGKPYAPLFDETVRRTGAERPIVVGDRLDTDIEGAVRCGADSLLVMTGVTDVAALCSAAAIRRPSYVAWTLQGLFTSHAKPVKHEELWRCGGWVVSASNESLAVERAGGERDDGLRALVAAGWDWHDTRSEDPAELDVTSAIDALDVH